MDAGKHSPRSTVRRPPGRVEGGAALDPASTVTSAAPPFTGSPLAALPGLMLRLGERWEVRYFDSLFRSQRRDYDPETGDCTYLDVHICASTALMLEADIAAWEARQ